LRKEEEEPQLSNPPKDKSHYNGGSHELRRAEKTIIYGNEKSLMGKEQP